MTQDKKEDRPILVVSDDAEEVRVVRELLLHDFSNVFSADSEEAGVRLFQERLPAVLVLVFQELERSERFYLMLYRQCPTIHEIPHQTLLLCKSNESEAAFSLCRNGTFDDYLINRPLHDPLRLRLAVQQALARQAGRTESVSVQRQLAHIGSDLHHLDLFVNKALDGGQAHQAESLKAFRDFASRLTRELDQFEAHMNQAAAGVAAKVIEKSGLRQQFDGLRRDRVEPDVRHIESKLQEAQQWAKQFDKDYRAQAVKVASHEFPPAHPEALLVDDDEVYREMLGIMLEEVGLRITQAASGEAALAEMRKHPPDIVLLDYNMPGLDGAETLERMKADPELRQIPVIMLSGVCTREVMLGVSKLGAAGFIVKPSNRPTILAKINSLLPRADSHSA
ncbi:MAG: response regulator [Rhodocyclaceae bacterium]|nr:response regulator [Rhodocyclaceae bacterium]